jgi:hypothetical protein
VPLARARHGLLPTGGTKPSALANQIFRGSTPSGPASPVTFAPRLRISRSIDAPVTSHAARLDTESNKGQTTFSESNKGQTTFSGALALPGR